MSIFKKNKISPFDHYSSEQNIDILNDSLPGKDRYLSLRASIFMAGLILTLSLIIVYGEALLALLTVVLASVMVSIAMGFVVRKPIYRPIVLFLNTSVMLAVIVLLSALTDRIEVKDFIYFVPLIAGVTALGVEPADNRKVYRKPDVMYEFVMPILGSMVAVALASVSMYFADKAVVSLMCIMSAVYLGVFSLIISAISGNKVYFTSPVIRDYSDIVIASSDNLNDFFKARIKVAFAFLITLVGATTADYLVKNFMVDKSELSVAIIPITAALIMMIMGFVFYGKRPRTRYKVFFTYESCFGMAMAAVPFVNTLSKFDITTQTITLFAGYYILIICTDFLVTGYFTLFKRRSVFAEPPKHFSGVPLLIIVCGVLLMCVEALAL